jgi:hypothetical protein
MQRYRWWTMDDQLTPFRKAPWRQDEPEHELEPRRILVQMGQDRFAMDLTTRFTVTRRPTTGPVIPLRKANRKS